MPGVQRSAPQVPRLGDYPGAPLRSVEQERQPIEETLVSRGCHNLHQPCAKRGMAPDDIGSVQLKLVETSPATLTHST